MKEDDYTDYHAHPDDTTVVEIVAYERRDTGWDVFVFEPVGAVPELESQRTDEHHIFIAHVESCDELDRVSTEIAQRLGEGYQCVPYYRETGTRRMIGHIVDHLQRQGARGMWVHSPYEDVWELHVRRKDLPLARQVAAPNTRAGAA